MAAKWWLVVATVLAIVSAAVLAVLASGEVVPSVVRDPLVDFVSPGVTLWWFVLGGPFRAAPSDAAGIAFAAVANALCWSAALWVVVALVAAIRRPRRA